MEGEKHKKARINMHVHDIFTNIINYHLFPSFSI